PGASVRDRRPISSENVLIDPRLTHTAETQARIERAGYRSVLSVPLLAHGRVIGTLSVGDRAGRVFDEGEVQLAQAFADHAALALETARFYEEAEQRRREAERIAAALRDTNEALQASEARYRAIVESQTELVCRFTAAGTLTFVNDAYCRYFNRTPA